MNTESTIPASEDPQCTDTTVLEQPASAPAAPRALSAIRITAIALLVMFFLPWGSVWIFTSCSPPESARVGSLSGREPLKIGTASGWDMANGKDYGVQSLNGSSYYVSIGPQPMAIVIPIVVFTLAGLLLALRTGHVRGTAVYASALFGSLLIGIVTLYIPEHVALPADSETAMDEVFREYSNNYYNPDPTPVLQWHITSWFFIMVLLTTMGLSGIVGLWREWRRGLTSQQSSYGPSLWSERHLHRAATPTFHDRSRQVDEARPRHFG